MRIPSSRQILILLPFLFSAGCATPGPRVDREELRAAHEFYEVKARRHIYGQVTRVRAVGSRLLSSLPEELCPKNKKPDIGLLLDDLSLISVRVFGIPGMEPNPLSRNPKEKNPWKSKKGCLIVGILPGEAAEKAGLQPGDILLRVGKREVSSSSEAALFLGSLKPQQRILLLLERERAVFERELTVGAKPYPVHFELADSETVNAFAGPGQITATTGLLRFVASDDELAVVISHELAHLTRGHYAKRLGTDTLAGVVGSVTGMAIDIVAPGVGNVIGRITSAGVRAPFSQDFEREADYVGLKYAYAAGYKIEAGLSFWDRFATELPESLSKSLFNTHPASPERLLRLKKTIEEIKRGARLN